MKRVVGIDVGSYNIKLVELEHKKGEPVLTKVGLKKIVGGDVQSALKDLLSLAKPSLKRVNVSLSGPSVIMRYIEMPPMKKEELQSAIKFEAEKYIPFNINKSVIDCVLLDQRVSRAQRVLLVAAKKDEVDKLLQLFKSVGLGIGVIDIDSFAFLNSFLRWKRDPEKDDVSALINMGTRFSNMNITIKDNVYFTRDILWGGEAITDRLKDVMGLDLEQAEALKQRPGERREEVLNIVMPVLERFTSQIRMSFDYFESQFGRSVERVCISGGTSYLFNIVDFLKDNLGVDTIMWNPFEGIGISGSVKEKEIEHSPALFAVAVGLALRK
jgi:type IV pilus assembly protein PilM